MDRFTICGQPFAPCTTPENNAPPKLSWWLRFKEKWFDDLNDFVKRSSVSTRSELPVAAPETHQHARWLFQCGEFARMLDDKAKQRKQSHSLDRLADAEHVKRLRALVQPFTEREQTENVNSYPCTSCGNEHRPFEGCFVPNVSAVERPRCAHLSYGSDKPCGKFIDDAVHYGVIGHTFIPQGFKP